MSSLDPGLGIAFLIQSPADLQAFEQAFSPGGPLSALATLY